MSSHNQKAGELMAKADAVLDSLGELKRVLEAAQASGLAPDPELMVAVEKIRAELGVAPGQAVKVGNSPMGGPVSNDCHWCTGGSGH
jgi:hypothetical protein